MKFSIVTVIKDRGNGIIDGVWMQNHVGSIESAIEKAKSTEKANGNRIKIAVVDDLNFSEPNYSVRTFLNSLGLKNERAVIENE